MGRFAAWARDLAAARLAESLPGRWTHVQAVAGKAENLRPVMGADADLLVAAAWLHDIGYAASLVDTGFHSLDGARYLRRLGADYELCCLVANHSAARYDAKLRNLGRELAEFPDERSVARDALWYCDMTTGPTGTTVTFDERLAELWQRYGPEHSVPRAIGMAAHEIRAAITHVVERVSAFERELDQRMAPRSPAR